MNVYIGQESTIVPGDLRKHIYDVPKGGGVKTYCYETIFLFVLGEGDLKTCQGGGGGGA